MNAFINPEGYDLVKSIDLDNGSAVEYHFNLHLYEPLTYEDMDGVQWQPNRNFLTDMGSIPSVLALIPGLAKDDRLISYIFHDSGYIHHGLYCRVRPDKFFSYTQLSRARCDAMLREMVRVDPTSATGSSSLQAWAIYAAVRLAGQSAWNKHAEPPA